MGGAGPEARAGGAAGASGGREDLFPPARTEPPASQILKTPRRWPTQEDPGPHPAPFWVPVWLWAHQLDSHGPEGRAGCSCRPGDGLQVPGPSQARSRQRLLGSIFCPPTMPSKGPVALGIKAPFSSGYWPP